MLDAVVKYADVALAAGRSRNVEFWTEAMRLVEEEGTHHRS